MIRRRESPADPDEAVQQWSYNPGAERGLHLLLQRLRGGRERLYHGERLADAASLVVEDADGGKGHEQGDEYSGHAHYEDYCGWAHDLTPPS